MTSPQHCPRFLSNANNNIYSKFSFEHMQNSRIGMIILIPFMKYNFKSQVFSTASVMSLNKDKITENWYEGLITTVQYTRYTINIWHQWYLQH